MCRERFEEHVLLDRQLEKLKSLEPALHQADCPESALWREIAAGVTPPKQALAHIHHASRCDHCGPLLRVAVAEVADLQKPTTEAEGTQIALLASKEPEWQREIAERLAGATRGTPSLVPWWKAWASIPRLALAGAALVAVVAGASWILIRAQDSASAGQLLARAYTERRTLEVRLGGAAYAPLRVQRGPEASFADRTPSLLKAEALIASQLPSHPSDSSWLQAKGRADLLEGKYDAAVESLRRALELSPDSSELMVDLASAYFQRAQTEDSPQDYGTAFEYQSKVLAQHPDDPVALFNRAIVSEHQFLYHQALDDWDRYLRVDPRSQWAGEARDAAERVRTKLKAHDASQAAPLLSPAQIAASADDSTLSSIVDARIEEYLSDAVRSWLQQAYPDREAADPAAQQALFFLAELTIQQHNDRWLSDLLLGSSAPNFPHAVAALARAVQANDAGEYSMTNVQASQSERLFRASGNVAGSLRAQFEQIFAAQLTRRSEACRQQATAALAQSEKYPYSWLQIQLGLEKGDCSGLMGNLGADTSAARDAMERARQSGYGAVYLRALGFVAGDQLETGNAPEGWRLVSGGLNRYWSGQFPAMRGYNIYAELAYLADAAVHPHLEMACWREGAALIESDEDLLLRAMAHWSMAEAATAARLPKVAQQQYADAARLFAAAPHTEASRSYGLENEVRAARLEARQGQPDNGIARLTSIQDRVRGLSNNYLLQMFYSTLGELQLRRHREAEAEQALRPAMVLAERSLATLRSEAERTNWSKDATPVYLALSEAELVQGRSQEALETYEWYLGAPQRGAADSRPQRSLTSPLMPDPSQLASRLPTLAKETVLAYAELPDGLAIWVFDDRGVHARWIPEPTEDLKGLAARFQNLSSDPKSELSALRRDARSLYAALIAPVDLWLTPERRLVIEADGWLSRIPFEVLLDSNDHYLMERAPIVHSLGRDSDARLRNDGPISADLPALVVGSTASSQAEGLVPLPDVAREADAVASQFRSAQVLKGGEATLAAVKNKLPSAAIFHFAGHSLSTPDRGGLLLENGDAPGASLSLLDADTLRRLSLRSMRLAVLSACSTESGSGGSGGFSSIAEALLRAGVPHVVASRWAVDSVEARGFVNDLYHNVLSGQPVSDAVRLTSQKMLVNPRTSHPYYWSAFATYGRP
jgi:CHAT domain-containing protein